MEVAVSEDKTIAAGDVERIFEQWHGLVFRTAYRVTGNVADAEDVLQAVFLRLMRRDRNAGPVDNQESYLRRAAINASLDIVRARQQSPVLPFADWQRAAADDPGELRERLRRALSTLSPRAAEIFALRFFEGRTNPEIARMLGISQVHVAVLLHRVRKQLRKELGS